METLLGKPAAANPEGAEGGPADAAPPGSQAAPGRRPPQATAVPPTILILQRCGCAGLRCHGRACTIWSHVVPGRWQPVRLAVQGWPMSSPAGRACSPARLPVVGVPL